MQNDDYGIQPLSKAEIEKIVDEKLKLIKANKPTVTILLLQELLAELKTHNKTLKQIQNDMNSLCVHFGADRYYYE